jgi:antitoxin component YwqK of YwqJK toxin-antitoxin module
VGPGAPLPGAPKEASGSENASVLVDQNGVPLDARTAQLAGNENASALVDRIEAAVVRIDTGRSLGSGFVVDPKGLICTNYHVINGASQATVTFKDQRSLPVLGCAAVNRGKDLAILSVQAGSPLPSLRLGANLPSKLSTVMAFGSPEGFSFTATQGNVSAIRQGDEVSKITLEIVGQDICRALGYDGDSTWIQSTAPISHGSSGGPLVDMQGEVVGINTWYEPKGQSLFFAVAAKHIAELLPKAGPPRPLSTLFPPVHSVAGRDGPNTVPGTWANPRGPIGVLSYRITFPSGDVLTGEMLATDRYRLGNWVGSASGNRGIAHLRRPDGTLYAICSIRNGALEGETVMVHPSNDLAIYATYAGGLRQGVVKTWNAEGKVEYWCQFAKGKRHGFCAFFKDADLQLVLQCDHGKTTGVHLISGNAISKSFADEDVASADKTAGARLGELNETESQLLKNEQKIKKQAHDEDQRMRQHRASSLNVGKRNAITSRANENAAENQAVVNALRRASGL